MSEKLHSLMSDGLSTGSSCSNWHLLCRSRNDFVGTESLKAVTLKISHRRFGGTYRINLQGPSFVWLLLVDYLFSSILVPEDGGSVFLRNVCELLPDYTVLLSCSILSWYLKIQFRCSVTKIGEDLLTHKRVTAPIPLSAIDISTYSISK
jgi:hypothetical protein